MSYLIVIAAIIILLYTVVFFKEKATMQVMLLGMQISVVGGFLTLGSNNSIGNISYCLLFLGFFITGAGFVFKN